MTRGADGGGARKDRVAAAGCLDKKALMKVIPTGCPERIPDVTAGKPPSRGAVV